MSMRCRNGVSSRILVAAMVTAALTGSSSSVRAQEATSTINAGDSIQLRRTFRGMKYTVGSAAEAYAVDPTLNLNFEPAFTDVLARHPDALAEVERAKPWLVVGFVGSTAMILGGVKLLVQTLNNSVTDDDDLVGDLVVYLGIPFGVSMLGNLTARSHMRRGVALFNERQRGGAPVGRGALGIFPMIGAGRDPGSTGRVVHVGFTIRAR